MIMKKGFTLIEFLIFMGLFSIIVVIMLQIFVAMLDVQLENKSSSSIDIEGDYLLARLSSDMGLAKTINQPSVIGSASATMNITLQDNTIYTYSLNGTSLQLNDLVNTDNLNGSETQISNLSFIQLGKINGKNSIKIHFTITSTTKQRTGAAVKNFDTTLGIR